MKWLLRHRQFLDRGSTEIFQQPVLIAVGGNVSLSIEGDLGSVMDEGSLILREYITIQKSIRIKPEIHHAN